MVREAHYPFSGKHHQLNGLQYHYLDEGTGEPVVMVHGNPTWSFYYRNLVQKLRDRYRVIAPDHIGCGHSDKPDDTVYNYTLKQRVDDLESLLEFLEIRERITLVLHDWGGMIGMAYASRNPDRIARLVIMNSAAFPMPPTKRFPPALWLVRNTPLGPLLVRGLNAFALLASYVCCKRRPLSKEMRRAYRAPYNNWANRIATLRFVQDIPLKASDPSYQIVADCAKGLARFAKKPILLAWGEQDFVFSREFLVEWQHHFPEAELHRFPECGHYILEDAAEELLPAIDHFLEMHPIQED